MSVRLRPRALVIDSVTPTRLTGVTNVLRERLRPTQPLWTNGDTAGIHVSRRWRKRTIYASPQARVWIDIGNPSKRHLTCEPSIDSLREGLHLHQLSLGCSHAWKSLHIPTKLQPCFQTLSSILCNISTLQAGIAHKQHSRDQHSQPPHSHRATTASLSTTITKHTSHATTREHHRSAPLLTHAFRLS